MITCKSPAAKRILAEHLRETEDPGITLLEVATEFAKEFGPLEAVEYEGPKQDYLLRKLMKTRKDNE